MTMYLQEMLLELQLSEQHLGNLRKMGVTFLEPVMYFAFFELRSSVRIKRQETSFRNRLALNLRNLSFDLTSVTHGHNISLYHFSVTFLLIFAF